MAFSHAQTVVATGTAATVVVTKPGSCTAGDLIVLTLSHIAAVSVTAAPSGFTQVIDAYQTATFSMNRVKVYWREATAGEGAAYTATTNLSGDRWAFFASIFRGHRSTDPIDASSSTFGSSSLMTSPNITLSASPCALVAIGTMYGGAGTGPTDIAASFTVAAKTVANVQNAIVAYNVGPWAAGATGTTTFSPSGAEAVHPWVTVMFGVALSASASANTPLVMGSLSLMGVGR